MDLFVCDVRQRALHEGMESVVSFQHIEKLDAGAAQNAKLNAAETQHDQLTAQLRTALERAGLFPAEAAAMVKTWEDSWLRESGVRVLYVLPRVWTDGVLPLAITPAPRDTVRVMVGRAEVITPAMDAAVAEEALRFRSTDEAERNTAIANLRALGLGRFLESAMRRLAMQHRDDRELSTAGWTMLQLASQPPAPAVSAR